MYLPGGDENTPSTLQNSALNMSRFDEMEEAANIDLSVLALFKRFQEDPFPDKISLAVGAYRTDDGLPWLLPVVKTAERRIVFDEAADKEYTPILGLSEFCDAATKLLLGEDSVAIREDRAFGVQCIAASGALRIGAEFLAKCLGYEVFYKSEPTYRNHERLFLSAGFKEMRDYRYWSQSSKSLDIEALVEDLEDAPRNAVVILHLCAHNPTGCDPTRTQWCRIAEVMKKRHLVPFFDATCHGLASGDLELDAECIRHFVSEGFELLCAQSFTKNLGLYGERVGNLIFVTGRRINIPKIKSQLSAIIRGMYSCPPSHGAKLVTLILKDATLLRQWHECLKFMVSRLTTMRKALCDALVKRRTPGEWARFAEQKGMFICSDLREKQAKFLEEAYHVYVLPSGRISLCGVNSQNVEYLADAIQEAFSRFIS